MFVITRAKAVTRTSLLVRPHSIPASVKRLSIQAKQFQTYKARRLTQGHLKSSRSQTFLYIGLIAAKQRLSRKNSNVVFTGNGNLGIRERISLFRF